MTLNRKLLLGSTAFVSAFALVVPAVAQEAEASSEQEATTVDEIIITGSLIRRNPENAPTPLIQVQREELLETGQTTMIDYLATIPALMNSRVPTDNTGSVLNALNLEFGNLRNLGSGRTLTLVDGRRHVGGGAGSLSVDVSGIPRLLIENIEIITGGASSIYGADAVSGVLNFILRKDFEGFEIDANIGQTSTEDTYTRRISALIGHNFFDDRLNLYLHAEYEENDEVSSYDLPWLARTPVVLGVDADPVSAVSDGIIDNQLFYNLNRMDRPRWGQTTLLNGQQPSALNNPNVAYTQCAGLTTSGNCFAVAPGSTFWYDNGVARLANFGTRVGNTGYSRPYNVGGDGVSPADFSLYSQYPEMDGARFQAGARFAITPNVTAFAEAKYIEENAYFLGQPTFFDINLWDATYGANQASVLRASSQWDLRWSDNAYLPQIIKDAIAANVIPVYDAPTADQPGAVLGNALIPAARHSMFGPERYQTNVRETTRFVAGLEGQFDRIGFVRNVSWDLSYTYGEMENLNSEYGIDIQRMQWASDAVVDTAGVLGTPGAIVCRVKLADAMGAASLVDYYRGGDIRDTAYGRESIDQCQPLNIFGAGNQSEAGMNYIDAAINVTELNEQHQGLARISGQLWDFWGAGPIGVALGYEYRKEYTEGVGRDADTNGRFLFLNTGPDFLGAEYDSNEIFTEVSIPLFRDSFLGEYAELSGSYRFSDYSTVGEIETWGVNLIYRPIRDIGFRTSFNTSIRVPNLAENFRPAVQTFWNSVVDPCDTRQINAPGNAEFRTNRIANCELIAQQYGFGGQFNWTDPSAANAYLPTYTSGIAGVNAGNPFLKPEESESFTFSTILRPRFIPNLSVVLDYYNIEVTDVIASVSAAVAAANCVNGAQLDMAACNTIFRNNPTIPFGIGDVTGHPVGGFIQGSINYAALKTEGLDFSIRYALDTYDWLGRDWGRFSYSLGGLWLLKQEQYTNTSDPTDATVLSGGIYYPRVRFTSRLNYMPNDNWAFTWLVDWQAAQHIIRPGDFVANPDSRPANAISTGDFTRHDFTVRWQVTDDVSLRAGVTNVFDREPNPWLGMTLYNNFDPFGRRFFVGVNYRLW